MRVSSAKRHEKSYSKEYPIKVVGPAGLEPATKGL